MRSQYVLIPRDLSFLIVRMLVKGKLSIGVFNMALIYLKKKSGASEENNKIKEDTTITKVTRFFLLNMLLIFFTGLYTR